MTVDQVIQKKMSYGSLLDTYAKIAEDSDRMYLMVLNMLGLNQ